MVKEKTTKGVSKFRPKARLLSILGNELISNEIIAVVELVKNSYDADATEVTVKLNNITNKEKASIEIIDNGCGMSLDIVLEAWLEPATNFKIKRKKKRTKLGRMPLGEKGVGRFSVDKLGEKLKLITRAESSDEEAVLIVEGKRFHEDIYLDEIENRWEVRKPKEIIDPSKGTILKISNIRTNWNKKMVERLNFGLGRLVSPKPEAKGFRMKLECKTYPEYNGEIEIPILKKAWYKLEGTVDDNGVLSHSIDNKKQNDTDLKIGDKQFQIRKERKINYRKPECGPFDITLYGFEVRPEDVKKAGWKPQEKSMLRETCGVSIYRDNFRVWPYGEPEDDWLELNVRRLKKTGYYFGKARLIGIVDITNEKNPNLRDKTNREGFIEEGLAYVDFKSLVVDVIKELEIYRSKVRPSPKKAKKDMVEKQLSKAKKEAKDLPKAVEIIKKVEEEYKEHLELTNTEKANLITAAGIGLIAERLTHEFSRSVINVRRILNKLSTDIQKGSTNVLLLLDYLKMLREQNEILENQLILMEPLYYSKKGLVKELNVSLVLKEILHLFKSDINYYKIKIDIIENEEKPLIVEMGKGHLLQIFDNLLDNSIYWLTNTSINNPQINIIIKGEPENVVIFSDNGPGIPEEDKEYIFRPFFSRKKEGRGLGLFIIQDILWNYEFDISLLRKNKLLKGANFVISLEKSKEDSND